MIRMRCWLVLLLGCWAAFAHADEATVPIRRVIVSHWHADHYYGLRAFKELGAEIWAHEGVKAVLGSDAAADRLAHRRNAYNTCLLMERESLAR